MPEPKNPDESQHIARLLLKAIDYLSERERKKVLEFLITQGIARAPSPPRLPGVTAIPIAESRQLLRRQMSIPKEELLKMVAKSSWMQTEVKMSPEQQMVPVRFSQDQYELFKSWCEANGFSMAVVVRGLVERFLQEQGKRAS